MREKEVTIEEVQQALSRLRSKDSRPVTSHQIRYELNERRGKEHFPVEEWEVVDSLKRFPSNALRVHT
ncbi:MAG TPA: hypothetical protein VJJ22_03015 [Candidatus Paceibacterota bacterium]